MVNFWALDTVPEQFRSRRLHVHNPNVTLMRTTAEECARLGEIIISKLNAAKGQPVLLLPLHGVSALDMAGQSFHDPQADAALFDALRRGAGPGVTIVELDQHINDPGFADALADHILAKLGAGADAVHRP